MFSARILDLDTIPRTLRQKHSHTTQIAEEYTCPHLVGVPGNTDTEVTSDKTPVRGVVCVGGHGHWATAGGGSIPQQIGDGFILNPGGGIEPEPTSGVPPERGCSREAPKIGMANFG